MLKHLMRNRRAFTCAWGFLGQISSISSSLRLGQIGAPFDWKTTNNDGPIMLVQWHRQEEKLLLNDTHSQKLPLCLILSKTDGNTFYKCLIDQPFYHKTILNIAHWIKISYLNKHDFMTNKIKYIEYYIIDYLSLPVCGQLRITKVYHHVPCCRFITGSHKTFQSISLVHLTCFVHIVVTHFSN